MTVPATSSFWIVEINDGAFSPIRIVSAYALFALLAGLLAMRLKGRLRNAVAWHKGFLQSLYASGIVIAGGFTLLAHRSLGRLTFGEIYPWINDAFVGFASIVGAWLFATVFSKPTQAWKRRQCS